MRRLHLFEFEDQEWLPRRFRNYLLEFLQYQLTCCHIYAPMIGKLKAALQTVHCRHLVDIGSGGGATILQVQEMLKKSGYGVSVTLTDKYPNAGSVAHINCPGAYECSYYAVPVDALQIPAHLKGFRTFFTSFHHFPPTTASAILRKAVEDQMPIGVFEFTERTISNLAGMLVSPVAVLALMLKTQPRTFDRFFWTYVLPVIPLLYWWDGTVSHWRTYSVTELEGLISGLGENSFRWDVGRIRTNAHAITYLIGLPNVGNHLRDTKDS